MSRQRSSETVRARGRRLRPQWIVVGFLTLAVAAWMVFGNGVWTLLTTARDPGDLDPAVFAQASATQWEVVADGLVTLDEYESAYDREIACSTNLIQTCR